jgi:putative membrane protein
MAASVTSMSRRETPRASQCSDVSVTSSWLTHAEPQAAARLVDASWNLAPGIVLAIVGYAIVYGMRWRRSRAQGGPRAAGYGRLGLWAVGLLCLAAALLSPIDRLGEQFALFHMVQHLLLADLAAVALTLALTRWILRPVTRRLQRLEQAAGPFGHPAFAAVAYVGVMWFWHVPGVYDAALENPMVHTLEHLSFAAAGLLYWWHLLSPIRSRARMNGLGVVLYMASTKVLVGFLGILLTFAPRLVYDGYARRGELWGITALEDQQAAGALMGLEQTVIMGVVLVVLFTRMLNEADREDERSERYGTT